MKKIKIIVVQLFLFATVFAQDNLQLQTFQLDNGLKVYLLPDQHATKTLGAVVVNAGSKNDPADATGLAHYLEHLLFKGTTTLGTRDYEKEKPYLDSITIYYQQLAKTKDEAARKKIKSLINNQAMKASEFGLPTEFHALLTSIGGTEINAFTQADMTVYHNMFPGEQMEKWLDLYSTRFINPVFRSFQSELEVVYEEKNRGSDNFGFQLFEILNKRLYPNHPYGTQTTIGTTEHLKNPPIDRIYEFFNSYYVSNNMALILSGNFNVDTTIPLIKEKFGRLKSGVIPPFPKIEAYKFQKNEIEKIRITPVKVDVVGFKTVERGNPDEVTLNVCNYLLSNSSETGLLNKLQLDGKLLAAMVFPFHQHDDGGEILLIVPKLIGQSFKKAEQLVFNEIDKVISGNFSEEFLTRVKSEMIKDYKLEMENPEERGLKVLDVFNTGKDWSFITSYPEQVNKITKDDVMKIARKYYAAPYFAIHSKTGFPKKDKLEKPGFKPALTNQEGKSEHAKQFESLSTVAVTPKFLDFKKDIAENNLPNGNKLYLKQNPYNDIVSIEIKYLVGTERIKNLDLAAELLGYCSVKGINLEEYKKQLAATNFTVNFSADKDFFMIHLEGDEKNSAAALKLVDDLLKNPEISPAGMKNIVDGVKATYKQEQKEPASMGRILMYYGLYKQESEYLKRISQSELKKMKAEDLLALVKQATGFQAHIHYCGNENTEKIATTIASNFTFRNTNSPEYKLSYRAPIEYAKTTIYVVNDSKARQNQVYFTAVGNAYSKKDDASYSLFNQYVGGSFSGLILQEIREYRSLAYSSGGGIRKPVYEQQPLQFFSFVGCQADKTNESIDVMMNLIRNLPRHEERIPGFQSYLKSTTASAYPEPRDVTEKIELLRMRGYVSDPLSEEYVKIEKTGFEEMYRFYAENLKDKPVVITIYGDLSKVDREKLNQLGEVIELKKNQVATY